MSVFGRYEFVRLLSRGGMAEVYLARSASLDGFEKDCVIKRIRTELTADDRFVSLFIDEARICMSLSHPSIVQVFDFGQADGSYYLAMEYVHGTDLRRIQDLSSVRQDGLDPALALLVMEQVLQGLEYAHTRTDRDNQPLEVVHRDISPHNVMVSVDGGVKIADFGIAKAKGRITHTKPGVVLGKYFYMAPEQAAGEEVDARADVFSCGLVLWELLAGKTRENLASETANIFSDIRAGRIDPLEQHSARVSHELSELVMRALTPSPGDRYQNAKEFGTAVHGYLTRHYPDTSIFSLQAFIEHNKSQLIDDISMRPPRAGTRRTMSVSTGSFSVPIRHDAQASSSFGGSGAGGGARSSDSVKSSGLGSVQGVASMGSADQTPSHQLDATRRAAAAADLELRWTEDLVELVEGFKLEPSLWRLLAMGDLCVEKGSVSAALAVYRVSAVKFAQRGLLAQCLLCSRRMITLRPSPGLNDEVATYPSLVGLRDDEVRPHLFKAVGEIETLLEALLSDVAAAESKSERTPLLSLLDGRAFLSLALLAPLRSYGYGETITREGDVGRSMYLLGSGRVLVYLAGSDGARVYLSSLSAGDFFGENGFFTGAPRSATVMAMGPSDVFEIDPDLYERVMSEKQTAEQTLLRFYKQRVVEAVLAKSPVFGLLDTTDRQALASCFELRHFETGATIIEEGAESDQIYLVKQGRAEVVTEKDGAPVVLSVLGPCSLFGEVAAIRGIPRTASVIARAPTELLALEAQAFNAVMRTNPDVRERVQQTIAQRARENIDLLMGAGPFGRGPMAHW